MTKEPDLGDPKRRVANRVFSDAPGFSRIRAASRFVEIKLVTL
jgi:hypothetical protein